MEENSQRKDNNSMSYTYVNEDEIDLELLCFICYEPLQLPVNCTKCGQTFCQRCIDTWKQYQSSCPHCREYGYIFAPVITRILHNQLNRLLVQCTSCKQTNIQRSDLTTHMSDTCPKQIVGCPKQCTWRGYREDLMKHSMHCQRTQSHWLQCFRRRNVFSSLF